VLRFCSFVRYFLGAVSLLHFTVKGFFMNTRIIALALSLGLVSGNVDAYTREDLTTLQNGTGWLLTINRIAEIQREYPRATIENEEAYDQQLPMSGKNLKICGTQLSNCLAAALEGDVTMKALIQGIILAAGDARDCNALNAFLIARITQMLSGVGINQLSKKQYPDHVNHLKRRQFRVICKAIASGLIAVILEIGAHHEAKRPMANKNYANLCINVFMAASLNEAAYQAAIETAGEAIARGMKDQPPVADADNAAVAK